MATYRRVVIKVGTSTLTHDTGRINLNRLEKLARAISELQNSGIEPILVTSGAISVGVSVLGFSSRPDKLREKQAAAAVGQCRLMHIYDKLCSEYGQRVSQILLSREDVGNPSRAKMLLNTIETLISWNTLPIINENDSVSPEEIESGSGVFGDNDTLSAEVARLVHADLLILLTDIDGLYSGDPRIDPDAELINRVSCLTDNILSGASGAGTARGTGGMQTKLAAASIALNSGFDMVIASGVDPLILFDIVDGKSIGTLFRRENK